MSDLKWKVLVTYNLRLASVFPFSCRMLLSDKEGHGRMESGEIQGQEFLQVAQQNKKIKTAAFSALSAQSVCGNSTPV